MATFTGRILMVRINMLVRKISLIQYYASMLGKLNKGDITIVMVGLDLIIDLMKKGIKKLTGNKSPD